MNGHSSVASKLNIGWSIVSGSVGNYSHTNACSDLIEISCGVMSNATLGQLMVPFYCTPTAKASDIATLLKVHVQMLVYWLTARTATHQLPKVL